MTKSNSLSLVFKRMILPRGQQAAIQYTVTLIQFRHHPSIAVDLIAWQ